MQYNAKFRTFVLASAKRVSIWDARNGKCKMQHDADVLLGRPAGAAPRDITAAALGAFGRARVANGDVSDWRFRTFRA